MRALHVVVLIESSIWLSAADNIRFCSVGLCTFGVPAAQMAIQKGFKMVAAFTRFSKHDQTVGQVLGMEDDDSLSFNVSPMTALEDVIEERRPHFCIDATSSSLESVFPHFRRLLSKGVHIVTLAEEVGVSNSIFPFPL